MPRRNNRAPVSTKRRSAGWNRRHGVQPSPSAEQLDKKLIVRPEVITFGLVRLLDDDDVAKVESYLPGRQPPRRKWLPSIVMVSRKERLPRLTTKAADEAQGRTAIENTLVNCRALDPSAYEDLSVIALGIRYYLRGSQHGVAEAVLRVADEENTAYPAGFQVCGEKAVLRAFTGSREAKTQSETPRYGPTHGINLGAVTELPLNHNPSYLWQFPGGSFVVRLAGVQPSSS